jgi:hypothetical protein
MHFIVQLCERGLADDQSTFGLLGDVHAWSKTLMAGLLLLAPLPPDFTVDNSPCPPSPVVNCVYPSIKQDVVGDRMEAYLETPLEAYSKDVIIGTVLANQRLTDAEWVQVFADWIFKTLLISFSYSEIPLYLLNRTSDTSSSPVEKTCLGISQEI